MGSIRWSAGVRKAPICLTKLVEKVDIVVEQQLCHKLLYTFVLVHNEVDLEAEGSQQTLKEVIIMETTEVELRM